MAAWDSAQIMEFLQGVQCARRSSRAPIPVVITAYADKSFTFIETPPATVLSRRPRKWRRKQKP